MANSRAVVVFSGGMDSITLLHLVKSERYEVYGLSFYYGQRHAKELEFAEYWGRKLCVVWRKVDISFMISIADRSALIREDIPLSCEPYSHENQKITVVPNRNMVMLSVAVAWAENMGGGKVFFGPHANDRAIYPDCREEFVRALNTAAKLGTYHNVSIEAPFVDMYKYQIAELGHRLAVDYSQTWSCYNGKDRHCGRCATCQERKEAFQKAGLPDPTEYEGGEEIL